MNTDSYFSIGKDHRICQDYAVSGTQGNTAFAIVSDGCSSSPDVDIGARMLALAAREAIDKFSDVPLLYDTFGSTVIRRADMVGSIFQKLNPEFLDATLLAAWFTGSVVNIMMYGDGVFFHKTPSGIRAVQVRVPTVMDGVARGAPDYLSYNVQPFRKERYLELNGQKHVDDTLLMPDGTSSGTTSIIKPFGAVKFEIAVNPGDVIGVITDGVSSFRAPNDVTLSWQDMLRKFADFKTYEGVFVHRRMAALMRQCQRDLITHSDDISMAAFVI